MNENTASSLNGSFNILRYEKSATQRSCDFACQADYKKYYRSDNCTCKRHKKTQFDQRVLKSHTRFSATEFGIERIKLVPKKRLKKLYLPETILIKDYYLTKKLSSKCVGGAIPGVIISSKSVAISQQMLNWDHQNRDICIENPSIDACTTNISQQGSANKKNEKVDIVKGDTDINFSQELTNSSTEIVRIKEFPDSSKIKNKRSLSSNSLIEHIFNLETPGLENHSGISIRPIENNLEREHMKMLSLKPNRFEKPIAYIKNQSLSEKSFEFLRQGLSWTKNSHQDLIGHDKSSHSSLTNHKDVSIESDPPSLEARSFSNTNICSPKESLLDPNIIKVQKDPIYVKDTTVIQNSSKEIVAQDVKTMFRVWGKKINFENECSKKNMCTNDAKSFNKIDKSELTPVEEKKKHKIFSLFKKKNKEKSKHPFKGKNVMAGRCELGDGIVINVDKKRTLEPIALNMNNVTKESSNILQKSWLTRFISKSVDARESVQIRWGNKYYGASSTTVFELMDCVHKDTSITFRSKSEISCNISEVYDNNIPKHKVKFTQDIKAWMMPNTICDTPIALPIIKDQRLKQNMNSLYCDKNKLSNKSKAQTIEIFLHADKTIRKQDASSEYITINIPEGYFSEDSECQKQSTDEEVYNIVEYEAHNSKDSAKQNKIDRQLDTGDYTDSEMKVTINVKGSDTALRKTPPQFRDVIIQDSTVYLPNVIGVGIITQKDFRHTQYPMIKIQDCLTDDESKQILKPHKKCKLAESYLQDYCQNILPLGLDLLTSYASESQMYTSSEHNSIISESKQYSASYSNVCKDYRAPIISSCKMPDCSECRATCKIEEPDEDKIISFLRKLRLPGYFCTPEAVCIRTCPKDSLEVYKRRKVNAESNKSNWGVNEAYKTSCMKPSSKPPDVVKKRVTIRNTTSFDNCPQPLQEKLVDGILQYKGASCETSKSCESLKQTKILPKPVEIPQPACKEECETVNTPACSKKDSKTLSHTREKLPDIPSCTKKQISTESSISCDQFDRKLQSSSTCSLSRKCNTNQTGHIKSKTEHYCPFCNTQVCTKKSIDSIPTKMGIKKTTSSQESLLSPKKSKCQCTYRKYVNTNKDMKKTKTNTSTEETKCKLLNCPNMRMSELSFIDPLSCQKRVANVQKNISPARRQQDILNDKKGLHLKIKQQPKNDNSNACIRQDKDYDIIKINSKENIMIRLKQETPSTGKIRKEYNIKVQDEDGRTLYERKDYKRTNEIANKNKSNLVRDMYRDSYVNRIAAANIVNDQKCLDIEAKQSNLSVSNVIEINLTLKFKQPDKNTDLNQNQCDNNCNDVKKSDIQGTIGCPQEVYIFEEEKKNHVEDRKDLNLNITIQNMIQKSVHRTTVDVSNSLDKLDIFKEPLMNDETKEIFSTSKISNSSIINDNKTMSQTYSKTTKKSISIISAINSYEEDKNIFSNTQEDKRVDRKNLGASESIEGVVSTKLVSILKKLGANEKKEVLKLIFETVGNINEKNKKTKFKRIQHLLHAVLTSDSSDFEDGCMCRSLSSTNYKEEKSLLNYCTCDSKVPLNISSKTATKSKDQIFSTHDSIDSRSLCSDTEKLSIIHNNNNFGCCCKMAIDKNKNCNLSNQPKYIEVETQDSRNIKFESVVMTNISTTMEIQPIKSQKISRANSNKQEIKRINKDKLIYFASDKVLFFLSDSADTVEEEPKHINKPEDILQLKETKKAVLEIYSQKRISNAKGHITAKLPKFVVSYKERQLRSCNAIKLE